MHIAFYREVKEFTQEIVNLHLGLYKRSTYDPCGSEWDYPVTREL